MLITSQIRIRHYCIVLLYSVLGDLKLSAVLILTNMSFVGITDSVCADNNNRIGR